MMNTTGHEKDTTRGSEPSKAPGRRQLLKGAAALGALTALQLPDLARATEADAAAPSLVGTWIMQIESGGARSVDLTSFSKDGLVFDAGSVPLKASPQGQSGPSSAGLGAWAAARSGGFDATFVNLSADPKGNLQGTVTINAHVTLGAGGATLSGTFTLTGRAWEGPVVFSGKGTVTGKRITIRPM